MLQRTVNMADAGGSVDLRVSHFYCASLLLVATVVSIAFIAFLIVPAIYNYWYE